MKYTAQPWHFIFPLVLFCIGVKLLSYGNEVLSEMSIGFYVVSFSSYLMIVTNGTVSVYIEYWREINHFSETMLKHRNPDLWKALGFNPPEQKVVIETHDYSNGDNYVQYEKNVFPVTPEVMKIMAEGILLEGKTFSEGEWVVKNRLVSSSKFRQLQKLFSDSKYIHPNNISNLRMGYSFTKKGVDALRGYMGKELPAANPFKLLMRP